MRAFKDTFNERLTRQQEARKTAVQRFRDGADDPAIAAKRAELEMIAKAREERIAARAEAKRLEAERLEAERIAREIAEAKERVEREAREAQEKIEREAALEVQRKAERDARYAARKARKKAGKG